jgi:hypothetical protein
MTEFDMLFKYGRFIIPHLTIIESFQFILDHIFGLFTADKFA